LKKEKVGISQRTVQSTTFGPQGQTPTSRHLFLVDTRGDVFCLKRIGIILREESASLVKLESLNGEWGHLEFVPILPMLCLFFSRLPGKQKALEAITMIHTEQVKLKCNFVSWPPYTKQLH
jgi:hypothetical protein